jgi:general secretion pathway protein A
MYTKYYSLTGKPFSIVPDPDTVYMSESHQEALAILRYGVIDRKGFLLLTGGVGTGKTTLLQLLLKSIDTRVHYCLLANPTLSVHDFYYYLSAKYELPEFDGNKAKFLLAFGDFLKGCGQRQERVLLIVDEAHAMPVELLEEIRLLSNQEYQDYGVMSVFLVGQPELNEHLAHERLLPLRQRIGIRYHLQPFSCQDTSQYIIFRLGRVGGQSAGIFSPEAVQLIHEGAHGVPRLINIICDQAMLNGFALEQIPIDAKVVGECVQELKLWENDADYVSPDEALSQRRSLTGIHSILLTVLWITVTGIVIMASLYVYWGVNPVGIVTKFADAVLRIIFSQL